ncbi:MAG TPA: CPBP family intramembrane glutamic endopeptidase [Xanthobacteraceae bacterium]|nr:CPBP family intramembrane glutamic endopeptidase [Xanthobacteraceae bacterium]
MTANRSSQTPVLLVFAFAVALAAMVASQIARLQQSDPAAWLAFDYGGRILALAILFAIPAVRAVAFKKAPLSISWWETAAWIAAVVLIDKYPGDWLRTTIDAAIPGTRLGTYPKIEGGLRLFDLTFGLALVAVNEEVLFRRCCKEILLPHFGEDAATVVISALIFAAYHWWSGIGNIVSVAVVGVVLMIFFLRARALWPAIVAHYLTNVASFA